MTFKQIVDHADEGRIARARDVVITKFQVGLHKKTGVPTAIAQSYSKDPGNAGSPKADKYITKIEFKSNRNVIVGCSCYDFTFRYEFALAKKGAAVINYSNGQPPNTTNPPPRVLGCCKHCIALYKYMEKKKIL